MLDKILSQQFYFRQDPIPDPRLHEIISEAGDERVLPEPWQTYNVSNISNISMPPPLQFLKNQSIIPDLFFPTGKFSKIKRLLFFE